MEIIFKKSNNLINYNKAVEYMEKTVNDIIHNESKEQIWFLEHPPIYTAGSSALESEILNTKDIPIFKSGRGGKHTYHGPGQRVIYLMLDLKKRFAPQAPDLKKYVFLLEEIIIETLKEFRVKSFRCKDRIGIWVDTFQGEKKIAAIGIRVRKWVAYHGIAINISPNLLHFKGIIPCGISNYGVTSLEELGKNISMLYLNEILEKKCTNIFSKMRGL